VSDTALVRPDHACVLHAPPTDGHDWALPDDGYATCERCLKKSRAVINDIRAYYRRLDATPGAVVDNESRGAPGFGSQSSANPHIIVMRDKRSKTYAISRDGVAYVWDPDYQPLLPPGVHGPLEAPGTYIEKHDVWYGSDGRGHSEQSRPPRSIPKALASIGQMIAEEQNVTPPAGTVDQLCHWLDVAMDYVTRFDWVADVDEELRSLKAQLKPVVGEGRKHKILDCPNVIDDGEHTSVCGNNLYEPDKHGTIRCHACKREWTRDKWHGTGPEYLSQVADDVRPRRVG